MNHNKVALLILSCDKFSDLWEGHIKLLDKNWPDRNMETYIVTDKETEITFPGINIISAGSDSEWSQRLYYALDLITTEYVFVVLDDYYLVDKVSNGVIESLLTAMDSNDLDYIRLYKRPKRGSLGPVPGCEMLNKIDTNVTYTVNLYAGLWKRDFLKSAARAPVNAWKFEVSLSRHAKEYNANCCVCKANVYKILDVVRKGKILHKAARYFKNNPGIYAGDREIQSWSYEIRLNIKTWIGRIFPRWANELFRVILRKFGYHFYRDDV